MRFRLKSSDLELLKVLADYRLMTTTQLTMLLFKGKKGARRRLAQLAAEELVNTQPISPGRSRGRAEHLYFLTEKGGQCLLAHWILPSPGSINLVNPEKIHALDHELLVGWFRIHLLHVARLLPRLAVDFFTPNSPFAPMSKDGRALSRFQIASEETDAGDQTLIPDGVFRITNADQEKSVLFFLEVDRGTEPLASPDRQIKEIRRKILGYQTVFRSEAYKVFEQFWGCQFNGFRLLFLAHSLERMSALCRLVQAMPPSDFIWVADQGRMFAEGLGAAIWARGGHGQDRPSESILNWKLACRSPLPSIPE